MKKLFYRSKKTGAVAVIGLGLLTISAIGLKDSKTNNSEESSSAIEAVEDFTFLEISDQTLLVDKRPEKIMFYDSSNELVYETNNAERHNQKVEVLIRRSDFLMEFDGVRYYHLND